MFKKIFIVGVLLATVWVSGEDKLFAQLPTPGAPATLAKKSSLALEQRALNLLKEMSDTLTQAKAISFNARSIVPVKEGSGMWVSLYGSSLVIKKGREKLFVQTRGDFSPFDFYFDGTTITTYSAKNNLYAQKNEPGTVNSVIENAYQEEGRFFPYADLLVADPYRVLTKNLIAVAYVGQSTIAGVLTEHLVFKNEGVQWQIWIGAKDHLPRLVEARYFNDSGEPSYTVEFSDWKINQLIKADQFIFVNKSKAVKVEFRQPSRFGS